VSKRVGLRRLFFRFVEREGRDLDDETRPEAGCLRDLRPFSHMRPMAAPTVPGPGGEIAETAAPARRD
jgi:hypothetical protein